MPKRSFDEAVRVKSPCSESWDEMKGNDRVRFCSHCAKDVNDISRMTRREAMRLVRKSKGGLCVRYEVHPVSRKPVFISRLGGAARRTGIAAGVIAASIAMAETAYAQGGAVPAETAYAQGGAVPAETVRVEQAEKTGAAGSSISGYVTDAAGAVIPFAVVSLSNLDTHEYRAINATAEGYYEFKDLAAGNYSIKFEAGGFDARQVEKVSIGDASDLRRDMRLEVQQVSVNVEVKAEGIDLEKFTYVTVGVVSVTETTYNGRRYEPNELVRAVLNEDLDRVKELIAEGAKVNARDMTLEGMSPLHAAIESGNIEIMQYLLAYGAKPNIRDKQKRTPLMVMDEDAEPEMIRILLSYGADIRLTDSAKNTVLHYFAGFDEPELMHFLVQHGADPNARNKQGRTPLMIAAESDNPEAMRALLESGADIAAVTRKRQTAWDLAGGDRARAVLESFGLSGANQQ
jgi:ankyrin repeat protein